LPRLLAIEGVSVTQPGADLLTFLVSVPFIVIFFRRKIAPTAVDNTDVVNGSEANGNGVGPAYGDGDF
jgi:hypothetical protein